MHPSIRPDGGIFGSLCDHPSRIGISTPARSLTYVLRSLARFNLAILALSLFGSFSTSDMTTMIVGQWKKGVS